MLKRFLLLLAFCTLASTGASAANRFAVCTTTCTWDGSSTAMWSASTGGGTGASVPGASDDVILDAATCVGGTTCTITVNTNFTVHSLTMGACTASTAGCVLDFSANNNSPTITSSIAAAAFSGTGTGVRTLNMGNGTWTVNGGSGLVAVWNMTTTTSLTFNAGSSTLIVVGGDTAAASSFQGGGLTYATVTLKEASTTAAKFGITIGQANTFATLSVDTSTAPFPLILPASTTTTVTTALPSGTSGNNRQFFLQSSTAGTQATLAAPNSSNMQWAILRDINVTGTAVTATNSFGMGNNAGITITAPVTGSGGGGGTIIGG